MSQKIGRNDPCFCGSGKKYKNCHMAEEQAAQREKMARETAARWLRGDLIEFAQDERFAGPVTRALPLYWNGLYTIETADEMSEDEGFRFFDWLLFDYVEEEQPRLIDLYYEENREELSQEQAALLEAWRDAMPAWAYELTGVDGQILHLRDFAGDKSFEVYRPAGKGEAEIGDVILARLLPVGEQLQFSTTAAYLPQAEIADLADKLAAARQAYQGEQPDGSETAFRRSHNHLLIHHALEQAEQQGRPPVTRLQEDSGVQKRRQKAAARLKRQGARGK